MISIARNRLDLSSIASLRQLLSSQGRALEMARRRFEKATTKITAILDGRGVRRGKCIEWRRKEKFFCSTDQELHAWLVTLYTINMYTTTVYTRHTYLWTSPFRYSWNLSASSLFVAYWLERMKTHGLLLPTITFKILNVQQARQKFLLKQEHGHDGIFFYPRYL